MENKIYKDILVELKNSKDTFENYWKDLISKTEEISTLNKQLESYYETLESYNKDLSELSAIRETTIESIGGDASITAESAESEDASHATQIANMKNDYITKQKKYNHYQDIVLSFDEDNYIVVKYFMDFVKEKYNNIIDIANSKEDEVKNSISQELYDSEITKLGHDRIIKMLLKMNTNFFPQEKNKKQYLQYLVLTQLVNIDKEEIFIRLGHYELNKQRKEYNKVSSGKNSSDVIDSDVYNQYKQFVYDYEVASAELDSLKNQIDNIFDSIQRSEGIHKEVKNENERYIDAVNKKKADINDVENRISELKSTIQQKNSELEKIKSDIKENNGEVLVKQLKKSGMVDLTRKIHGENDELTDDILFGFSKEKRIYEDFSMDVIVSNFVNPHKPLLLVYECDDKEQESTNNTFYSIADNILASVWSSMFVQGFELEIVDNRNQERTALTKMSVTNEFVKNDLKEKYNAFKFSRTASKDYFEKVIQDRTDKLNQEDIISVNEKKKDDSTMEKYLLLCYRVYEESDISVDRLYTNLKECDGSGVFPFVFIDMDTYSVNKEKFDMISKNMSIKIFKVKIGGTYNEYLNFTK